MRTIVICSDGKAAIDLGTDTENSVHEMVERWFQSAAPHDVLTIKSIGSTTIIQKSHIVRIEVYP